MATCAVFRFSYCHVCTVRLFLLPGANETLTPQRLSQAKGLKGLVYLARAAREHSSAPGLLSLLLLLLLLLLLRGAFFGARDGRAMNRAVVDGDR